MTWIMILLTAGGPTTATFQDRAACERAIAAAQEARPFQGITGVCVPKATRVEGR